MQAYECKLSDIRQGQAQNIFWRILGHVGERLRILRIYLYAGGEGV